MVSELKATQPGLYLEVLPHNAEAFADLVPRPDEPSVIRAANTPPFALVWS